MINELLQVAEFLIKNCQFLDAEEIFEISIQDKRIIEKNSDYCQEVSRKTFTSLNLYTNFHEQPKGPCLPKCNEEIPIHRGSTSHENLHHHKKNIFPFLF